VDTEKRSKQIAAEIEKLSQRLEYNKISFQNWTQEVQSLPSEPVEK
jgi:hypothetical protein